jgi:hypothetical protein
MYLCLTPNLFHFLPDLGALYTLRHAPNYYEMHPKSGKKYNNLGVRSKIHDAKSEKKMGAERNYKA